MAGLRLLWPEVRLVKLSVCQLGQVYSMTPREQDPGPSPTPQGTLYFRGLSSKCVNVPSGTEAQPGPTLPPWWSALIPNMDPRRPQSLFLLFGTLFE